MIDDKVMIEEIPPTEDENEIRKSNFDEFLHYTPTHGMVSLSLLSIYSLDPFVSSRIFLMDPTRVLLISSTMGAAQYLYTKNPIKRFNKYSKIIFSISGGMIFSIAAMYGWHLLNQILPDMPIVNSIIGLTTTYEYIRICQHFVSSIN